jgi:hypothetical protein
MRRSRPIHPPSACHSEQAQRSEESVCALLPINHLQFAEKKFIWQFLYSLTVSSLRENASFTKRLLIPQTDSSLRSE